MIKRLIFAIILLSAPLCLAQVSVLGGGGIGISCNAITTATSTNPGLTGGCTSLNLVSSGNLLPSVYTWQVITTGSPATVTVNLMGSIDGSTWVQIDTISAAGTRTVGPLGYRFIGCVPATLTGGTAPTVTCQVSVSGGPSGGNVSPIPFAGVPTGTCLPTQVAVNTTNGNLYTCNATVWTIVSGSGGAPVWNAVLSATGNATFANTTFNTTLSNTAATNFLTHSNTTAATNLGVNPGSPVFNQCGDYFTLGATAVDCWTTADVITAGVISTTVTNVAETAGNVVTLTITGGTNFVADMQVTFTGLTTATWLNNKNVFLTTASATSLTFTDPTSHGTQTSAAETGQVTQANPVSAFTISHNGSGNGASPQTMTQVGEATFIDGTTYPSMNIGQLSVPGRICSTTGASNYGTGFPAYGFAMHDVCPVLFTKPAPSVNGTSSHSIMGLNVGIATAFPDNPVNVFALNGQLTTPSSYAGNQWAWYGVYHESDHNGSGVLHLSEGTFGATYNNGNGSCAFCEGGHFEAIGNFYGGANTPTTTKNVGLSCNSGVKASATHVNDFCFEVQTPVTGGTFTNGHVGIKIDDQTNGGVLASAFAIQIGAGNNITSGFVDLGANNIGIETTGGGTGVAQINAPTGTYGSHFFTFGSVNGFFITSPCLSGKVFLNADFTSANAAGLQAITGLGCAFPNFANTPNASFQCNLMYSQATNVAGDQFGVSFSASVTNFNAWGRVDTNTGAATPYTTGTALAIPAATNTAVVTFQPGNTGLNQAQINGTIEASGNTGTFQLYVTNGTAADVIVVKRSSYCQFF
jgi:hypothetical protein